MGISAGLKQVALDMKVTRRYFSGLDIVVKLLSIMGIYP